MKNLVIYNLTRRGFYSEIMNLCLAKIYCDFKNYKLIVNSRNWNARQNDGLSDYFIPYFIESHNYYTSQYFVEGKMKRFKIKQIIKHKICFLHELSLINNSIYKKILHIGGYNIKYNDDIWNDMRSSQFINSFDNTTWINMYSNLLKHFYQYNKQLNALIKTRINEIILPAKYIGVHIRKGDKIKEHDIQNIYIATDDISIIPQIKKLLPTYNIFYNHSVSQTGFCEKEFNKKTKNEKVNDVINVLIDVEILKSANYFIGTFSSNLSQIIPCFIKLDKCTSIDIDWHPIF